MDAAGFSEQIAASGRYVPTLVNRMSCMPDFFLSHRLSDMFPSNWAMKCEP